MERLTPAERAVYVLREAFGHPHREIAEIVGVTEAHGRQLHRRAREHLDAGRRPPAPPDRDIWLRLVERFVGAARDGDVAGLERCSPPTSSPRPTGEAACTPRAVARSPSSCPRRR